ncbi:MAG: DUF975 family protein [Saprospiraceae bacterium]|nr:MAG: hypothetical protein UZ09_BCD002001608 [Bacteroidetes bacterium OLB9]MCO6463017.1 DUF975 family protein [Saprospiraceae bacterium]
MGTDNFELMKEAKEALSGKWFLAIIAFIIYALIISVFPSFFRDSFGSIISIIIGGPIMLGVASFYLSIARGEQAEINQLFSGFNRFVPAFITYVMVFLIIMGGMILLIIPGVIAALGLAMTFYIMRDDEHISGLNAIKKSWAMMDGYKMKLFILTLIFLGLGILCILTLGIGFLFLGPFAEVCLAKFYDDINGLSFEIDEIGEVSQDSFV